MVDQLFQRSILATGLTHLVVLPGSEEIRFNLSTDHMPADVDVVLAAVRNAWSNP
ncbi:MAG: hypothetical protein ACR2PG_05955 [Hyphomicrobiaceae bacterium]